MHIDSTMSSARLSRERSAPNTNASRCRDLHSSNTAGALKNSSHSISWFTRISKLRPIAAVAAVGHAQQSASQARSTTARPMYSQACCPDCNALSCKRPSGVVQCEVPPIRPQPHKLPVDVAPFLALQQLTINVNPLHSSRGQMERRTTGLTGHPAILGCTLCRRIRAARHNTQLWEPGRRF